jgi:hypothetical protein
VSLVVRSYVSGKKQNLKPRGELAKPLSVKRKKRRRRVQGEVAGGMREEGCRHFAHLLVAASTSR